jgi:heat shock protein HtpX
MFLQESGLAALVVVMALVAVPAVLRWWWGRSLARLAEDPLIAERLQSHHSRAGMVTIVCIVLILLVRPLWFLWAVPALIVLQLAAAYPLSRTLYGETWSLTSSLSFYGRLTAAVVGFWILLGATPWIVVAAGGGWIAAAGLAAVLIAWDRYFADILRRLLRSEPIADPVLLGRFAALVTASGISAPRFEQVNLRGGVLANALALGSPRGSSILFTDTLLARLSADETVGICAHEIAHLEYYEPRRLRRMQRANWLLIAIVCALIPISRILFPSIHATLTALVCSAAVAGALVLRGQHRQRNETASDLRAVELTGDADSLARALTTLHAIARVPRRWDQLREQQSTHPSLARRIRDIHAGAGGATRRAIEGTATFNAARGETVVTFDSAHLHWQERPGTAHLLAYEALSELRLHAGPSGSATLVAVERLGRKWTMPTRPEDAAPLQSVLDAVDGRLGDQVRRAAVSAPVSRLVAVFGCTLVAMLGHIALAVVALAAALVPSAALLNATGVAALAAAAVTLRDGTAAGSFHIALASIVALLGVAFLVLAHSRRDDTVRGTSWALGALAIVAGLAASAIGLGGFDPIRLHQGARSLPGAAVLLVAVAAGCWSLRNRPRFRSAALAAALAGLAAVTLGSTTFLDRIGQDPFLVQAGPLRWQRIDADEIASFDIPFEIESIRLSPNGRLAAIVRAEPEDGRALNRPATFHLWRNDGPAGRVQASDLAFVDDATVLRLEAGDVDAEVSTAAFDGPVSRWRQRVPDIHSATLSYNRSRQQWVLIGRDEQRRFVRVTGVIGTVGFERRTWKGLPERGGWVDAVGSDRHAALVIEKRYGHGLVSPMLALRLAMAPLGVYAEASVWKLDAGTRHEAGRSLLDVTCVDQPLENDSLLCTAFDGTRTRITAVAPATGAVSGFGIVDGEFIADNAGPSGWIAGWSGGAPMAIRFHTREAFRPPRHAGEFPHLIAPSDTVIGTVMSLDGAARVRLYPLPAKAGTLTRAE